jgi:predicted metal-dependent TIM-barrel fold hydrolase
MKLSFIAISALLVFSLPSIAQYPGQNPWKDILNGAVDMHLHTAPDMFERSLNDVEAAQLAAKRGMRAIVIKNHVSSTAARVELVNELVDRIEVFGGIALNKAVGGINPAAVEAMVRISPQFAKVVWFSTFDAAHHQKAFGGDGKDGLRVLEKGKLTSATLEILQIIHKNDLVLATGHLSPEEVKALVAQANSLGITRILITHSLADTPGLSLEQMKELAGSGAYFELTFLSFLSGPQAPFKFLQGSKHVSLESMVEAIRTIGAEQFVLSTDLGQSGNPTPPDGLLNFIGLLAEKGITRDELKVMVQKNPAFLLGLE